MGDVFGEELVDSLEQEEAEKKEESQFPSGRRGRAARRREGREGKEGRKVKAHSSQIDDLSLCGARLNRVEVEDEGWEGLGVLADELFLVSS